MLVTALKSKIHRATVTASEIDYEGSITIDAELMQKVGLFVGEKVLVVNLNNGQRVETYVIKGRSKSGVICMNGAAAHYFSVSDRIIIMSFAHMNIDEAKKFKPTKIKVNEKNKIVEVMK